MVSYLHQPSEHKSDHTGLKHGFAMIYADLIVSTEASGFKEPAERAFDDPASGQHFESFDIVAPAHNFQAQFAEGTQLFNPLHQRAQVAAISPDELQPSESADQPLNQSPGSIAVLDRRRGNHDRQDQAQTVHSHVPLASSDLFPCVIAALSGLIWRLDRLTVDDGSRGCDVATLGFAHVTAQAVVDELPGPVLAPAPEITIDRLPRPEISGQQSPRTAGANDLEDGIHQTAPLQRGPASLALARLGCGNQRFDILPFFITEVSWVL